MENNILLAASLIKSGHVVAFPTETVYGLGASIFQEKGLEAIFSLKKRAKDNPLIVHIHDLDQVLSLARDIPEEFYLLAKAFFPGPLTIILPKNPSISSLVTASLDTIAIRMPSHEVARQLLKEIGEPVAAPSANLSGKPSPTSYEHVVKDFAKSLSLILDGGQCQVGIESTVLSLVGEPALLRPGSITLQELEEVLGRKIQTNVKSSKALCPGMKYRHYAPDARIFLVSSKDELLKVVSTRNCMVLSNVSFHPDTLDTLFWQYLENAQIYAYSSHNIYKLFHLANEKKVEVIYILIDENTQKNLGLMNRIEKAASQF